MEIKTKILDLRKKLNDHNYNYYVLNDPIVSDSEYDVLLRTLQDIEEQYPGLVTEDSPTQRVGASPIDAFESINHRVPMLSLENAMDSDELISYYNRTKKGSGNVSDIDFIAEPKLDGIGVELVYENGKLKSDSQEAMASKVKILHKI